MSDIIIKNIDGIDVVQYQPIGVCSRMMQIRIKDNVILDAEFIGGCNGNLSGIGVLVKGMTVEEVVEKLQGLHCGNKSTSCPDQLSKGLQAYIEAKGIKQVTV